MVVWEIWSKVRGYRDLGVDCCMESWSKGERTGVQWVTFGKMVEG